jgi:lipopolysaccharide/colanic/teichoic acid biosynthesis glycosyltransferase
LTNNWKIEVLILPWIDALALGAAFYLGFWLRLESGFLYYGARFDLAAYHQVFLFSLPLCWMLFYSCHLYDLHEIYYGTTEYIQVIKAVTFAVLGMIVVTFILHSQPMARGWLLLFWIFGIVLVGLSRFLIRRIIRPFFRSGRRSEPTLVVGASEEAKTIAQTLKATGRFDIVGFLDDFSPVGEKVSGEMIVKGSPEDYERIAKEEGVSKLILVPGAVSWETYREISLEAAKWNGLDVLVAPRLGGLLSGNLRVSYIGYVPMLRFRPGYASGLDKVIKTFIDLSLGLVLFLVSLPMMLFVAAVIWWQEGRPIFESHKVLGLHGRPFHTYKFFTGSVTDNNQYFQAPTEKGTPRQDCRVSWVERTGLDKLPQLINVLLGQMSLVGPRTVKMPEGCRGDVVRLQNLMAIKPGLTGPWAFGPCDYQEEIAATLSYIHTWTPWKDLQILCLTLFYLLQKGLMVRLTARKGP